MELCPYCKKRPKVRETCAEPECQIKHKNVLNRRWWKKNGYIYKGAHRKRGKNLLTKQEFTSKL